jgi:hypothetical protein
MIECDLIHGHLIPSFTALLNECQLSASSVDTHHMELEPLSDDAPPRSTPHPQKTLSQGHLPPVCYYIYKLLTVFHYSTSYNLDYEGHWILKGRTTGS